MSTDDPSLAADQSPTVGEQQWKAVTEDVAAEPSPRRSMDEVRLFALEAAQLHDAEDLDGTLDLVMEFSAQAVGCASAALTLISRKGQIETAAATDDGGAALDRAQAELEEGPGLSAIRDEAMVRVDDVGTHSRWPRWQIRASDLGYRSALCVVLRDSTHAVGSLNLYARVPHAFDEDDVAVAHILARHAGIALARARELSDLTVAIDARKLIGQAQGILMERYGLDGDQAFAVLRRYSQHTNVKLRIVAQRLIDTRALPDDR